jgi:hypothetical protein
VQSGTRSSALIALFDTVVSTYASRSESTVNEIDDSLINRILIYARRSGRTVNESVDCFLTDC